MLPDLNTIKAAHARILPFIKITPVLTSTYFNELCDSQIFFKCENFQKVGAFKFRGAMNALLSLPEAARASGIITHSSGNHGQAVALAAKNLGIRATVVMPENSVQVKVEAIRGYGAEVVFCPPGGFEREQTTERIIRETGAALVHPYNDAAIIAGQGTAFLELHEQVPDLDVVITPVGGGGLLSGTAIAARDLRGEKIEIWGAEPEGADDAARSLRSGQIVENKVISTVADGLRTTSLGELTFLAISQNVDGIHTVSDDETLKTMRLVWERMKIIIEPSSAVPLAALIKQKSQFSGRKIGIILTGGNVSF